MSTQTQTHTQLRAYAWLPEGTIGIGANVPHGAFMIAAAPLDDLYRAIRATARRDAVAPGCYSLPGSPADPDQEQNPNPNRTAVTAFLAYRRTIRAYLNTNPDAHPCNATQAGCFSAGIAKKPDPKPQERRHEE